MPNASDYEFESAFEDAFASLITAAGIDCATQRDTDDLTTPRAEVKFTLGDARADTISGDSTDGFYHAGFNATVDVATVTTRDVDGSNHMTNVGKVRHALRNRGAFTSSILANHIVNDIVLTASQNAVEGEFNLDITTDSYAVAFVFRNE